MYFSDVSVDFQRTTWCYNPEDITLPNHRYESLKSHNLSNSLNVSQSRAMTVSRRVKQRTSSNTDKIIFSYASTLQSTYNLFDYVFKSL
jgi:hypothetical protein